MEVLASLTKTVTFIAFSGNLTGGIMSCEARLGGGESPVASSY